MEQLWSGKGATLSDTSACKEFGLTQEEIFDAIKKDKLQYRQNFAHGNSFLRLLRHEVEALVSEKYGHDYTDRKKLEKELSEVNKQLRKLKTETKSLEQKKITILKSLN